MIVPGTLDYKMTLCLRLDQKWSVPLLETGKIPILRSSWRERIAYYILGVVKFSLFYWYMYEVVWKVHGLTLLPWVGTLWRHGDGLFFEVPPLASDTLLTMLHTLIKNVLQTICHKLQEDSGADSFDLGGSSFMFVSPSPKHIRHLKTAAHLITSSS
jgi:hypothetical protein